MKQVVCIFGVPYGPEVRVLVLDNGVLYITDQMGNTLIEAQCGELAIDLFARIYGSHHATIYWSNPMLSAFLDGIHE
jgi:hypothetical protein